MTNLLQLGHVLCLSPHRDDECLSCGGLLTSAYYKAVHIHYFNSIHPLVDQAVYDAEANAVQNKLHCTTSYSKYQKVNELHTVPIANFVSEIEFIINQFRPDTVIIPAMSYNQDHRVVLEAALTACRIHDRNWVVKNVLLAEQPETHTPVFPNQAFVAHAYVPIDMDKKLDLYHLYTSQQRSHRSDEHIKALATFRGMQCGVPFAEAFMVVRVMA